MVAFFRASSQRVVQLSGSETLARLLITIRQHSPTVESLMLANKHLIWNFFFYATSQNTPQRTVNFNQANETRRITAAANFILCEDKPSRTEKKNINKLHRNRKSQMRARIHQLRRNKLQNWKASSQVIHGMGANPPPPHPVGAIFPLLVLLHWQA